MAVQHDEMESKFRTEIAALKPKEEELKVGMARCSVILKLGDLFLFIYLFIYLFILALKLITVTIANK